ncbi:restriction endonuclease subunit S [Enterococcus hirae]|nr:restriction endonuclease subunit S [Enterococcus hirae]
MNRKMKDCGVGWIGEIPESWELRKLKYILDERKEKNNPVITDNILSLSIEKGVFPYSEKTGGGNKAKDDLTAYKVARPNDIVINSMNILAGAVGISNYTGAVSPVYYTLYSSSSSVNIKYYYYLFLTETFQKSLLGLGNGIMMKESANGKLNTIRMRISMDKLASLYLPILSYQEQERIVKRIDSFVKRIDAIISETQQSIDELKKYKQALITETVTKGLDKNVEMKDSGIEWIGQVSKQSTLKRIKSFLKVKNGKEIENDGGEIPVYGSGGIFKWTDEVIFNKPSVLFGRKGTIGKPLFVENPFWTVDTMFYTDIDTRVAEPMWVYYVLNILPWDYYSTQTALPSIVGSVIENIKVPYTGLHEQRKIVSYLNGKIKSLDNLIQKKEQMIIGLMEYKNAEIYEYATGKKEA